MGADDPELPHQVFVYGTLKAGGDNHHWLSGAHPLGRRRLRGGRLHDLGGYPMAVLTPGGEEIVHGELYRVSAAGLARLDRLEDYPELYNRCEHPLSDGSRAWVYHGRPNQVRGLPTVPLGDWGTTPVLHYGSNLDPERLRRRCPDWDGHGLAVRLEGWGWALDKLRHDGTGCAGLHRRDGAVSWGVVTHLSPSDLERLDGCEGVATGNYTKQRVRVHSVCGSAFPVLTYVPGAAFRRTGLVADPAYREHVLAGLRHWNLPASWRAALAGQLGVRL